MIARPVAPLLTQLSVAAVPELILPGLALKEVIVGGAPAGAVAVEVGLEEPPQLVRATIDARTARRAAYFA
jgi:hypothetical protein